MLRLMGIQRIRERQQEGDRIFQVTLDRDGIVTQYEFIWHPPPESRPGFPELVEEPIEAVRDLLDYHEPAAPGKPCGAAIIPPLSAIIQSVYKVADGKTLNFPIVLDER